MSHKITGLFCRIYSLLQGSCAKETYTLIDCKKFCDLHVTQLCHVTPYELMCVTYGVATVSRIDKIVRLFCRIYSLLQGSCAKETYSFIDCKKVCDWHVTEYVSILLWWDLHGVATMSKSLADYQNVRLFCRIQVSSVGFFCKRDFCF